MRVLRWLSHDEIRKERDADSYRVMLFLPLGQYPGGTIVTPSAVFHADSELVFSVTLGASWRALDESAPYSEFDWASPQELRLLASMLLCEKRDEALIRYYPVIRYSPRIAERRLNVGSEQTVAAIKDLLIRTAKSPRDHHGDEVISECLAGDYSLVRPEHYDFSRIDEFWRNIDVRNYVLMRGLYALIKSEMLACRREFWEEAIIVSYIALEATFQLVLRKLSELGVTNPSSHNAARWLHENFDKPFGLPAPTVEKYFEEFYEDRIRTLHPSSRFGESPYAPIMHDDFVHLRRALREIFAFLVSGTHGPDFLEDVRRHGQARLRPT